LRIERERERERERENRRKDEDFKGEEKKRYVHLYYDFRDSSLLIYGFFQIILPMNN
jgi:hypothetical protein